MTDDGPVYHALGVHVSRAELITRSTIDMSWQNSLSPEFRKKSSSGKCPYFVDTWISLKQCRTGRKEPLCQKPEFCPSVSIEHRLVIETDTNALDRRRWQEAQLSPRNRAMRRVSWNIVNCRATVQKLLLRQVLVICYQLSLIGSRDKIVL